MRSTRGNPDKARTGWTRAESFSLCALYRLMLQLDAEGQLGRGKGRTSKKELVLGWIAAEAPHRSHGSVEAKLMNISASRDATGLDMLKGYKPLTNRSADLDEIVGDELAAWLREVSA